MTRAGMNFNRAKYGLPQFTIERVTARALIEFLALRERDLMFRRQQQNKERFSA